MQTACFVSALLAIVAAARGYSIGAPVEACRTMAPDPGPDAHAAQPLTTPPPFVVTIDVPCLGYAAGKKYKMTIRPTDQDHEIEGFLCQVRKADGTDETPIGIFNDFKPKGKAKSLDCTHSKGAVTHKNEDGIHSFEASWKAPTTIPSYNLRVFCTIVHHKDEYWVKVPSSYFKSETSNTSSCVHGQCVVLNGTHSACQCESGYIGYSCDREAPPPKEKAGVCDEYVKEWSDKFREWKALFDEYQKKYGPELTPDTHGHSHD